MKKIISIMVIMLLLCGCSNKEKSKIDSSNDGDNNVISNKQMNDIMAEDNYLIIDVRTKEEFNSSHIKDAINIPYNEIDENIDLDKNKIIFVYCYSGGRSTKAAETLSKLGYIVYNLGAIDNIDLPKE